MTIKTAAEIDAALADNVARSITPQNIRDALDSVIAVGGTMYATDTTEQITGSWAPFAAFEASVDTKGLVEDLAAGTFEIGTGADGVYAVDASVSVSSPGAGRIEVALTQNDALTPYRAVIDVTTGDATQFVVQGSGNLSAGDTIGLAWKGPGTATMTVHGAQFRAVRI